MEKIADTISPTIIKKIEDLLRGESIEQIKTKLDILVGQQIIFQQEADAIITELQARETKMQQVLTMPSTEPLPEQTPAPAPVTEPAPPANTDEAPPDQMSADVQSADLSLAEEKVLLQKQTKGDFPAGMHDEIKALIGKGFIVDNGGQLELTTKGEHYVDQHGFKEPEQKAASAKNADVEAVKDYKIIYSYGK